VVRKDGAELQGYVVRFRFRRSGALNIHRSSYHVSVTYSAAI
jgi:hypothetical protein